jgi:hypothetical protein
MVPQPSPKNDEAQPAKTVAPVVHAVQPSVDRGWILPRRILLPRRELRERFLQEPVDAFVSKLVQAFLEDLGRPGGAFAGAPVEVEDLAREFEAKFFQRGREVLAVDVHVGTESGMVEAVVLRHARANGGSV